MSLVASAMQILTTIIRGIRPSGAGTLGINNV
jgi:hypothetical protein